MRVNPFAILVSSNADAPFATHVPVFVRETETETRIYGHVAKANPHWRQLQEQPQCMIIFHGPHAYISPTNYETREVVPTWNYGAVHVYGNARVFAAPGELLSVLHELIPMFEPHYADQWATLTQAYRERMLSHIVGFEMAVTRIEAKFKLSQNRTRNEQQHIIDSLINEPDSAISGTARLMCQEGLGNKKSESHESKKDRE